MKRCSYCGAEYPDELNQCPIDHENLKQSDAPTPQTNERKHEIPPLPATEGKKDWVMILSPHSEFEADIVLGRLRASGIRARFDDAVMGGGSYTVTMRIIQVRVEDYDRARALLNAA